MESIDISSWETKYAEANPDAIINPAESTNLLSFKNQQTAQPEAPKHVNKMPWCQKVMASPTTLKLFKERI